MVDPTKLSAAQAQALLAGVTEQQRQVLALGGQGYTSKEIARELGIAPVTVDQRFSRARLKLGGKDRRDTARIYAAMMSTAGYDPAIYSSSSVAELGDMTADLPLSRQSERIVADSEWDENGDQPNFLASIGPEPKQRTNFPLPSKGRSRNELNVKQRLFWIILVAILGMLALRTAIETMSDLGSL